MANATKVPTFELCLTGQFFELPSKLIGIYEQQLFTG